MQTHARTRTHLLVQAEDVVDFGVAETIFAGRNVTQCVMYKSVAVVPGWVGRVCMIGPGKLKLNPGTTVCR